MSLDVKFIVRLTRAMPKDTPEVEVIAKADEIYWAHYHHHMDMCSSCVGIGDPHNRDLSSVVLPAREASLKKLRAIIKPLGWRVLSRQDGTLNDTSPKKVDIVDMDGTTVLPVGS